MVGSQIRTAQPHMYLILLNSNHYLQKTIVDQTHFEILNQFPDSYTGSTISTLLHDKVNPKDGQVLSLGDSGFLQFFWGRFK